MLCAFPTKILMFCRHDSNANGTSPFMSFKKNGASENGVSEN